MNLLTDPVLTFSPNERTSLPGLFAAMARGEVQGFPRLRPHQRPAWHMFLVQLGALACWRTRLTELPTDADGWRQALRALTPEHPDDAPWCLVVSALDRPAFMQPPAPSSLKWSPVATPDAADMLITSRNHDLKRAVARKSSLEDWVFALISLQTTEGYGGAGNHGIARMNGGSSSRPMLGLAPAADKSVAINPSAWWARDVRLLLQSRIAEEDCPIGTVGGPALLWCYDWPDSKQQLDLLKLDPWFIEVCRRIRLREEGGGIVAHRSTSKAGRIDAKVFKGSVGDPWAPVHKQENKGFTLGDGGEFGYRRIRDLLYSGEWSRPLLAMPGTEDSDDLLLVAEAFARGNSKTEGFKSRLVLVPKRIKDLFPSEPAAVLSKAQIEEIKGVEDALRKALALMAAGGNREAVKREHYAHSQPSCQRFDRSVDQVFFASLWRRLEASTQNEDAEFEAKVAFLQTLRDAAVTELQRALHTIPCASIHRPRAASRAKRAFWGSLRKNEACRDLFNSEASDGAA